MTSPAGGPPRQQHFSFYANAVMTSAVLVFLSASFQKEDTGLMTRDGEGRLREDGKSLGLCLLVESYNKHS